MDSPEVGKSKSLYFKILIIYFSGLTTHLVVFDLRDMTLSKKLQQIQKFKKKPHIVNLDWLMDCMETGEIKDAEMEQYKI